MARNNSSAYICMCITVSAVAFVFGIPQIGVSILACNNKERLCDGLSNETKMVCDYANVVPQPERAYYDKDDGYHCGFSFEYPRTLMSTSNFDATRNGRPLCDSDYIKGTQLGMSHMCRGNQEIVLRAFDTGETSSDLQECLKNCASPFTDFGRKFSLSFETGSVGLYFAWWALIVCVVYRNEIKESIMSRLEGLCCYLASADPESYTGLISDLDDTHIYNTMERGLSRNGNDADERVVRPSGSTTSLFDRNNISVVATTTAKEIAPDADLPVAKAKAIV